MARKAADPAEQAEPTKAEEPKTAPATEEKAQEPAPKKAEEPKASNLVEVYNPQRYFYVQPSTGIRIGSKTVTKVSDDNWLALQVDAGILQRK